MATRTQLFLVGLVCFLLGCLVAERLSFAQAQNPSAAKIEQGSVRPATSQHGFELRVRRAGEAKFTKDTKTFGIEVFRDENNGNLVYISETGSIAVVPAK
jgi:hypothetical protein